VSEALERTPPTETLRHVPVGGWIRQDLGIWVGHPDKNRAWEELGRARDALMRAAAAPDADARRDAIRAGFESIHAAEASDWFWWYGDDHPSEHRADFDRLFRAYLARAYECAGTEAPASIRASLREDADTAATPSTLGAADLGAGEAPFVLPVVDGRETDFFEWRDAARHRAAGGSGSMHRASGALLEVRYGSDGRNLHVRADVEGVARSDRALALALVFPGPPERRARIPLGRAARGTPAWSGEGAAFAPADPADVGEYAVEEIVEIRIPFTCVSDGVQGVPDRIRFQAVLERESRPEEVAPATGWFLLRAASRDPKLTHWSAL
jgi:hypothetical protein